MPGAGASKSHPVRWLLAVAVISLATAFLWLTL